MNIVNLTPHDITIMNEEGEWQPGELLRDEEGRPTGCIGLSQ
jgi:hypothetical protein